MVYCSVFLYRVPKEEAEAFVQALKPIMKLFLDSGALSEELLQPKEMEGKFGSMSLPPAIGMSQDEDLWVEIARFEDASHMKDVHSAVSKNPHLEKLILGSTCSLPENKSTTQNSSRSNRNSGTNRLGLRRKNVCRTRPLFSTVVIQKHDSTSKSYPHGDRLSNDVISRKKR